MVLPILNKKIINSDFSGKRIALPEEKHFSLPERVLQFGTGVLLRGLPDFYIDKANKAGVFNGRIVVVKSTSHGDITSFEDQDYLYTQVIKGIEEGENVTSNIINASISRILIAQTQWEEILNCAADPKINIIISNTTEQGISYKDENIKTGLPENFPGKLLAYLYHRWKSIKDHNKSDIVVIPTELIENNGDLLKKFIIKGSEFNTLGGDFLNWLYQHVKFCNSLVDRIVPGKPTESLLYELEKSFGYIDQHLIISEAFHLWAIEGDKTVADILSFSKIDMNIHIVDDISVFKELKLRLLNATHILSSGIALIEGHSIVAKSLENTDFSHLVIRLLDEIKSSIPKDITPDIIETFANKVMDRFKNPYMNHQWTSIILNYTDKMKIRAVPLMNEYYRKNGKLPEIMIRGMAAYLFIAIPDRKDNNVYYKNLNGRWLQLNDPYSAELFQKSNILGFNIIAKQILKDIMLKNTILYPMADEIYDLIQHHLVEFSKRSLVKNE